MSTLNDGLDSKYTKKNTSSDALNVNELGDRKEISKCNGYASYTEVSERKQEKLTLEEVKDVYLKLKAANITPSAKAIREQIKHGSFSTLQKFISQLNHDFVKNRLSEIQKKRIPDPVMENLLKDLTERALKCTIKEDDSKIADLQNTILFLTDQHAKIESDNASILDDYISQISELKSTLHEQENLYEKIKQEKISLELQVSELTCQIKHNRMELEAYKDLSNLLKVIKKKTDALTKILEILPQI